MATITFKGNPISTAGELPSVGSHAPAFTLTAGDLSNKTLADFKGKVKILNIVPSLDTGICALSAKRFHKEAGSLSDVVVLVISADLPFAQGRFCEAEGIDGVVCLSSFRSSFGDDYRVTIADGPLAGLLSRAVMVLDKDDIVQYTEQVPEIAQEPDYDAVLAKASESE
jgi:thiol peroxidase